MRKFNRMAIVAAAFAPFVMLSTPANAAAAGAVVFTGDVTLPVFPCTPNCGATGTPNEAAPLVFTSDVAVGAGAVTTPAGVGVVNSLTARVKYSEPPCVAGEALTGTANGTATLNGTNVVGTPLPLTVGFEWLRVGLVAVVTGSPATNTNPLVVGAALFLPTGGAPNCTGGPLTAQVVGAAALVQVP